MKRAAYWVLGLMVVGVLGFVILAWRSEISALPTTSASTGAPSAEQIDAGARLALLGNCAGCHTIPGGDALAGGLPIETPFGAIQSTNITPDRETGIGDWSFAAYARAMREGVDREGRHLYPAFPYEYFARINESDMADLYAWNMAQPPVAATPPQNDLTFPTNFRPLLAGWKLLFHSDTRFTPSPDRSEVWNAGAYLAEGLGHCAACHSPRNILGGAMESRADQGGEAQGWWAPPLTAANPAPRVWTDAALMAYLRTGRSAAHGVAAGPMASVVRDSLALAPEEDTAALALYFADLMARPAPPPVTRARGYGIPRAALATEKPPMGTATIREGAQLFSANCSTCHHDDGPTGGAAFPRLSESTALAGPDPRNVVQVILWGIGPGAGTPRGYMPRFVEELSDEQIAAIAAHLRGEAVAADLVAELRAGGPVTGAGAGPLSGFATTSPGTPPTDMGATR